MKYKNTKTGAIIDSPCKVSGGDWIEYTEENTGKHVSEEVEEITEEVVEVVKAEQDDTIEGVTKKEIMQELDAMGVEYNPRAKKEVLYNLMLGK